MGLPLRLLTFLCFFFEPKEPRVLRWSSFTNLLYILVLLTRSLMYSSFILPLGASQAKWTPQYPDPVHRHLHYTKYFLSYPYPILSPSFFSPILSYRIEELLLPFRHFPPTLDAPSLLPSRSWLTFANSERQIVLKHEPPCCVFLSSLTTPFLLSLPLLPFPFFFFLFILPPHFLFCSSPPLLSFRPRTIGRKVFLSLRFPISRALPFLIQSWRDMKLMSVPFASRWSWK